MKYFLTEVDLQPRGWCFFEHLVPRSENDLEERNKQKFLLLEISLATVLVYEKNVLNLSEQKICFVSLLIDYRCGKRYL